MTNHWADIGNATAVFIMGANPSENHPACMAHINRARYPQDFFAETGTNPRQDKTAAKLVVVDPRKTRTALQADKWIRIRPGTDIAFLNGVIREIIALMEDGGSWVPATTRANFFGFLNSGSQKTAGDVKYKTLSGEANYGGSFYKDGKSNAGDASGNTVAVIGSTQMRGWYSKYTDARFLVDVSGNWFDYQRTTLYMDFSGNIENPGSAPATYRNKISNYPVRANTIYGDVDASGNLDTPRKNTVFNVLKAHVAPYTKATVADICGCGTDDLDYVARLYIENSRCASSGSDPRATTYRALTMLYAMGLTQHTCGSQNVKEFAVIQTLMGNMGRCGGGINALRGIHNVQGSTDMGLLYGNIPGYSGNPATTRGADANAFGKYMDGLWGLPVSGSATRTTMNGSYNDAYQTTTTSLGAQSLHQRGFINMTLKWFGNYSQIMGLGTSPYAAGDARRLAIDACYDLWPKKDGSDHITMFREMRSGTTKALVCWGQNPAITEPNQVVVREGLYNLDLLVCTDIFENETAAAARKATGVTYLLPTAAHVEKAGSATNSGRTLQWRYEARKPAGNTKEDTELLLRFARALDNAGCFSHIAKKWAAAGITGASGTSVYAQLYGTPYGYTPAISGGLVVGVDASGNSLFDQASLAYADYSGNYVADVATPGVTVSAGTTYARVAVTGSEAVAENIYREITTQTALGGTLWIYTGGYETTNMGLYKHTGMSNWSTRNRSKSRNRLDPNNTLAYPGWGFAWLVNRRVLYNNSEVTGDVADFFMGPDSCARLFVSTNTSTVLNYSRWYRKIHKLVDKPDVVLAGTTSSPHFRADASGNFGAAGGFVSFAGRFPAHSEPYETNRDGASLATNPELTNLVGVWGRNTAGVAAGDLCKTDTDASGNALSPRGTSATYPLVLTTIRCVEHFQGGPITRNNAANHEIEPEPWIELNSSDARRFNISDGDYVRVISARTEGLPSQELAPYGSGFKARVGSGTSANQRVGVGVCAIPWHWGEKGLSTGSRANDICLDAFDANTKIPESKVCLVRLENITNP